MTKDDEFFARANAPMSVPDRLKGLMDAATKLQNLVDFRLSLTKQHEVEFLSYSAGMLLDEEINETVDAEYLIQEEVSAWATALLADGTLDDCRDFLANRDQFQQFVETGKFEPQSPKAQSRSAALWSRLFGNRDADAAPSPTR